MIRTFPFLRLKKIFEMMLVTFGMMLLISALVTAFGPLYLDAPARGDFYARENPLMTFLFIILVPTASSLLVGLVMGASESFKVWRLTRKLRRLPPMDMRHN